MNKRFKTGPLQPDMHIDMDEFLDVREVMNTVMSLDARDKLGVHRVLENLFSLSNHVPHILGAVIGWGSEFVTQRLYDCLCNLFIRRHTYIGTNFWLLLNIPATRIGAAIIEVLQELMAEVLHHLILALEVAESNLSW